MKYTLAAIFLFCTATVWTAEVGADFLGRWLGMKPEERVAKRDQFIKTCAKAGAAVIATTLAAEVSSESPKATRTQLEELHPRDSGVNCWKNIVWANCLIRDHRSKEAIVDPWGETLSTPISEAAFSEDIDGFEFGLSNSSSDHSAEFNYHIQREPGLWSRLAGELP